MSDIDTRIKDLVHSIHTSSEYTQYHILYEELKKDPELLQRVNEYRKNCFILEMKEDGDLISKMNQLKWDYGDILGKTIVKEFLSVEQRYIKLYRSVQQALTEAMNLDVDFLD